MIKAKLTDSKIHKIKELKKQGKTIVEISKITKVSESSVRKYTSTKSKSRKKRKVKKKKQVSKQQYLKNKEFTLQHKYGISLEYYTKLYNTQKGKCKICGEKGPDRGPGALHLDHCHKTLAVRGFLCARCNTALGKFKDDPELLRKAADYLEEYKAFVPF